MRQAIGDLVAHKRHVRRSGYQPTWQDYAHLRGLKERATALCCLRAHHRGKLHLQGSPEKLAANASWVEATEKEFLLNEEAAA